MSDLAGFELQNSIINNIIKEERFVTVYTTKKGVPIRCKITGNDKFTLLLDVEGKQQLVFKSGISTILAGKQVMKF